MELFIKIKDGMPFEHPILAENFYQAFPEIDVNNLPSEFARFERISKPIPNTFEIVSEKSEYQLIDGVYKDVWTIRAMTAEEQTQKIQELTDSANEYVEYLKIIAQQIIDAAQNDAYKDAWIAYLAELNAWVLVDVVTPNIPNPPTIQPDGSELSNLASGSEPNVIG
jgi:hypothetical protein